MTLRICLPLFFMGLLGQRAGASPSRILVADGAPQAYRDSQSGQYDGESFRLFEYIKKHLKMSGRIEVLPWKRIERMTEKSGNFIVLGIARTPEREDRFTWISPIYDEKFMMVALKTGAVPVQNPEAMKSRRICRSFMTATTEMAKSLELRNTAAVPKGMICARQLHGGRTEAWIGGRRVIVYYYRKAGYPLSELRFSPILYEYPIYVAASRNTPPDEIQRWREAIEAARSDGSLESMQADYEF